MFLRRRDRAAAPRRLALTDVHRSRKRLQRVVVAGASLLATTSIVLVALTTTSTASPAVNYTAGTLVIPMDTDTSGNHTAYNQNLGMWKAYGLVYKLLQNNIDVGWAIKAGKTSNTDIDFTVASAKDKRTGTALGSWTYRGGAFIVDSADAARALPIIQAWWAANANYPNVHEAQGAFTADVRLRMTRAPRIANELINAGIAIAYYNAAGIPDANGNPWTTLSPNVLDETEIANGGLFTQSTTCPQRAYDIFVTPHNGGYKYSLTDPTDLGTRTYAQLDRFVHDGGGWTAVCHSILSNENNINDLTRNGSAAVKNLFYAGRPGATARVERSPWRVVVTRSTRQASVYRGRRLFRRFPVVVGAPATPTPFGHFFVVEHVQQEPGSALGPWAIATSAFSHVLQEFDGGPGQIALHGRAGVLARDPLGTARSHGCIRFDDDVIRLLARLLPNGTPVDVD